jgi:hypothetical protein
VAGNRSPERAVRVLGGIGRRRNQPPRRAAARRAGSSTSRVRRQSILSLLKQGIGPAYFFAYINNLKLSILTAKSLQASRWPVTPCGPTTRMMSRGASTESNATLAAAAFDLRIDRNHRRHDCNKRSSQGVCARFHKRANGRFCFIQSIILKLKRADSPALDFRDHLCHTLRPSLLPRNPCASLAQPPQPPPPGRLIDRANGCARARWVFKRNNNVSDRDATNRRRPHPPPHGRRDRWSAELA